MKRIRHRVTPARRDPRLLVLGVDEAVPCLLTEDHWTSFEQMGFLHLGPAIDPRDLSSLIRRIDALRVEQLHDDRVVLPLEAAADAPARSEARHRAYQFWALLDHPLCHEVARRLFGPQPLRGVTRAEALFLGATPTQQWRHSIGTSAGTGASTGQVLEGASVMFAVDALRTSDGAVEALPGSHHLRDERSAPRCRPSWGIGRDRRRSAPVALELDAGEALLIHPMLLQRPGHARRPGRRAVIFDLAGPVA